MSNSYNLDGIDIKILKKLQKDARAKVSEIAEKLNLPHSTVLLRINKMEDKEVILGYNVKLNPKTFNRNLRAIIEFTSESFLTRNELVQALESEKAVTNLIKISGEKDGIIMISVRDVPDLDKIVSKIRLINGIKTTNTILVLTEEINRGIQL